MATIDSLAPELLLDIMRHTLERDRRQRGRSLASLSLVSRRWREPAQSILWARLYCDTENAVVKCLSSGAIGRYPTGILALADVEALGLAEVLISNLEGLQSLILFKVKNLTKSFFEMPALAGLTSLQIVHPESDARTRLKLPPTIIFRLQRLTCDKLDSRHLLRLIEASGERLTDLQLTVRNAAHAFLMHSTLPSHLLRLTVPYVDLDLLAPSLRLFTRLQSLRVPSAYEDYDGQCPLERIIQELSASTSTLSTFVCGYDDEYASSTISTVIRCLELPALARLKSLQLSRQESQDQPFRVDLHSTLLLACEKKGLEVVVTFDHA